MWFGFFSEAWERCWVASKDIERRQKEQDLSSCSSCLISGVKKLKRTTTLDECFFLHLSMRIVARNLAAKRILKGTMGVSGWVFSVEGNGVVGGY